MSIEPSAWTLSSGPESSYAGYGCDDNIGQVTYVAQCTAFPWGLNSNMDVRIISLSAAESSYDIVLIVNDSWGRSEKNRLFLGSDVWPNPRYPQSKLNPLSLGWWSGLHTHKRLSAPLSRDRTSDRKMVSSYSLALFQLSYQRCHARDRMRYPAERARTRNCYSH